MRRGSEGGERERQRGKGKDRGTRDRQIKEETQIDKWRGRDRQAE